MEDDLEPSGLLHAADGLPAVPVRLATHTAVGAAHVWAQTAKLERKKARRWRLLCFGMLLPYIPFVWLWLTG